MTPTLIAIDIQKGFHEAVWGERNNPEAESHMGECFEYWRKRSWPIIHVQHLSKNPKSPLRPGQAGIEFMEFAQARRDEVVMQKSVNSAFIGTSLETHL